MENWWYKQGMTHAGNAIKISLGFIFFYSINLGGNLLGIKSDSQLRGLIFQLKSCIRNAIIY